MAMASPQVPIMLSDSVMIQHIHDTAPTSGDGIFQLFDRDCSGGIDRTELVYALNHLGLTTNEKQAAEILAKFDVDFSGVLELDEFTRLVHMVRDFQAAAGRARAQPDDEITRCFRTFDTDQSNSIEHTELYAALNALGLTTDIAGAGRVLCRYDADGNGRLDADEFRRLVNDLRAYQE